MMFKIKIPKGWRALKGSEVIQRGDIFWGFRLVSDTFFGETRQRYQWSDMTILRRIAKRRKP